MDAVDAVLLSFDRNAATPYRICGHHSRAVPPSLREDLHLLSHPGEDSISRLGAADIAVGRLFAETALELLSALDLGSETITAIGSHGQTVRHHPPIANRDKPFTLQIGDPNTIAVLTGITTVADFRRKDMALGGEAAPLAPAFHRAVFQAPARNRAVVNIGGIANITWLPATASGQPVVGFDTGPGNCLMDGWIGRHSNKAYDHSGAWARSGTPIPELLELLITESYLSRRPPKSTGKELFNLSWLENFLERVAKTCPPKDVQATLCDYTALTIAHGLEMVAKGHVIDDIYVCGGGAFNDHLMANLSRAMPGTPVQSTMSQGVHPLQVEGAAFAWLAHQTLNSLPGNIPEVTGASRAAVLGGIYLP